MKKILLGAVIIAGISAGMFLYRSGAKQATMDATSPAATTTISPSVTNSDQASISLDEIALHNTAADCWLAIEGKVYNVTPFIESGKHPGGPAITFGCGKDATEMFMNRPKDNEPHSQRAIDMLPQYQIGVLRK